MPTEPFISGSEQSEHQNLYFVVTCSVIFWHVLLLSTQILHIIKNINLKQNRSPKMVVNDKVTESKMPSRVGEIKMGIS